MKIIKKIILYARDGSLNDRIIRKTLSCLIKNTNTRNKLLEDIALDSMRKTYSVKLKQLVRLYQADNMEYSNKVWIFWRQGYEEAPDIVKACVDSVRRCLADRDIIFLSQENIKEYINLPAYIEQKKMGG